MIHFQPHLGGIILLNYVPLTALFTFLGLAVYSSAQKAILPHKLTLGGAAFGLVLSVAFPDAIMQASHLAAFKASIIGFVVGLFSTWTIVELGKLFAGRIKEVFQPAQRWRITQPNESEPPVLDIGASKLSWNDIFTRPSDRLILQCDTLRVNDKAFGKCRAEISQHTMSVFLAGQREEIVLGGLTRLEGQATEVVIPREALGFGVVLLTSMVGSFLGWKGALFTLVGSFLLMFSVVALYALSTRKASVGRLEVAPFALVACLAFVILRRYSLI